MIWKKKQEPEALRPDRIRNMEMGQLKAWLNSSLMELGAVYDHWAYHGAPPSEVTKLLNIVTDLWKEIDSRS